MGEKSFRTVTLAIGAPRAAICVTSTARADDSNALRQRRVQSGSGYRTRRELRDRLGNANLQVQYHANEAWELAVGGRNLLDENYQLAFGYPEQGRTCHAKFKLVF